jgi:hypothetical protein
VNTFCVDMLVSKKVFFFWNTLHVYFGKKENTHICKNRVKQLYLMVSQHGPEELCDEGNC